MEGAWKISTNLYTLLITVAAVSAWWLFSYAWRSWTSVFLFRHWVPGEPSNHHHQPCIWANIKCYLLASAWWRMDLPRRVVQIGRKMLSKKLGGAIYGCHKNSSSVVWKSEKVHPFKFEQTSNFFGGERWAEAGFSITYTCRCCREMAVCKSITKQTPCGSMAERCLAVCRLFWWFPLKYNNGVQYRCCCGVFH